MNRTIRSRKTVFFLIFALLSSVSLTLQFEGMPVTIFHLVPFSAAWAVGMIAVLLGYPALFRVPRALAHPPLWCLAALFAAVVTLAQSFAENGTMALLTQSPAALAHACLFLLGRIPLYYMGMALLTHALRPGTFAPTPGKQSPPALRAFSCLFHSKSILPLACLLLLFWLPYYICTFPGTVSNDSITQLKEIFGIKPLSAGNPMAQTFLLWAFCGLGQMLKSADAGVALYCAVQGVAMAFLLAYTLRMLPRFSAPRWLCLLSFAFFALCPVFPIFAFCVGKDTNFAMATLYFSLMVWALLTQPRDAKTQPRLTAGLCLSAAGLTLLRNPGIYLAVFTLVLLWIACQKRVGLAKLFTAPLFALLSVMLIWAGLHFALIPLAHIEPMPETENYSLPLQHVARVIASQPESLTPEEEKALAGVLPLEHIKAAYNGELSDPVKDLWNPQATQAEKDTFFQTWRALLIKHPATCFSATFHNTYGYLCPGYVSTIKPTLLLGKQAHTTEIDPYFSFSINPLSAPLKAGTDALLSGPLRLILAPGLYGWLTLFALCTLVFSTQKRLLLPALPALFAFAGCLLSAVNGYFRYALPLYFCAPLLMALCACALNQKRSDCP